MTALFTIAFRIITRKKEEKTNRTGLFKLAVRRIIGLRRENKQGTFRVFVHYSEKKVN